MITVLQSRDANGVWFKVGDFTSVYDISTFIENKVKPYVEKGKEVNLRFSNRDLVTWRTFSVLGEKEEANKLIVSFK